MSVVVAVESPLPNRGVGIAWDSGAFGEDSDCDLMVGSKVYVRHGVAVAAVGSHRAHQLIQHLWTPPEPPLSDALVDRWLATDCIPSLIELGKEHLPDDGQQWFDGIIATAGCAYAVSTDWGYYRSRWGYVCAGAASAWAEGSLVSSGNNRDPEDRAVLAVGAAARHCCYASGPVDYLWVPA